MRKSQASQLVHETSISTVEVRDVDQVKPGTNKPSHKERVRASLAWALDEYEDTLAKLAK